METKMANNESINITGFKSYYVVWKLIYDDLKAYRDEEV